MRLRCAPSSRTAADEESVETQLRSCAAAAAQQRELVQQAPTALRRTTAASGGLAVRQGTRRANLTVSMRARRARAQASRADFYDTLVRPLARAGEFCFFPAHFFDFSLIMLWDRLSCERGVVFLAFSLC